MSSNGAVQAPAAQTGYVIHLTFFLNAKHRVSFGRESSPVHGHSWRLEVRLAADFAAESGDPAVEFADLDRAIRAAIRPYEGKFLNDLEPFDRYAPATENIARFLYGAVGAEVKRLGVRVLDVTLWEAPTKGITVRTPLPGAATAVPRLPGGPDAEARYEVAATWQPGRSRLAPGETRKGDSG